MKTEEKNKQLDVLFTMGIHETIFIETNRIHGTINQKQEFAITRVDEGWIYVLPNGNAVFVPKVH